MPPRARSPRPYRTTLRRVHDDRRIERAGPRRHCPRIACVLQPQTAFIFDPPAGIAIDRWPVVHDVGVLREARRIRSGNLIDPARGMTANRALGIVVAGGDGKANLRGFGRTNSAEAFGHPGFGGQIGWADPATGISFGYLTNGYDRNDLREGRRSVAVCSLAGASAE
jgi:hypothetical protein